MSSSPIGLFSSNPEFTRLEEDDTDSSEVLAEEGLISKVVQIVKTSREGGNYDFIDQDLQVLQLRHPFDSCSALQKLVQQVKQTTPSQSDLPVIYQHLFDLSCLSGRDSFFEIPEFLSFDEDFRIACAKIAVAKNPQKLCENIQKYGITDQKALVDIATFVAGIEGAYTKDYISQYIDRLGIQSEKARFEIAKIALKNENNFSRNVAKYHIESDDARIELAINAIAFGDETFSECIENYFISDGAKKDLAYLLVDYYAASTSSQASSMIDQFCLHFRNAGISEEADRIALAKRLSEKHMYSLQNRFQNFEINDQEVLIELAKQAAMRDGPYIAKHIYKFNIKKQEALVELARIAVEQSGTYALRNFHLFDLDDQSKAALFARVHALPCMKDEFYMFFPESPGLYPELNILRTQNHCNLSKFLFDTFEREGGKLPLSSIEPLHKQYQTVTKEEESEDKTLKLQMLSLRCSVLDYANNSPTLLKQLTSLLDAVDREKIYVKKQQMLWLAEVMMICRAQSIPLKVFQDRINSFEALLKLKDPSLRSLMTKDYIDELLHPVLDALLQGKKIDPRIKQDTARYFCTLALSSLCPLIAPYWEPGKQSEVSVSFIDRMHALLSHKSFKDAETTKSFFKNLFTVVKALTLTETQKARILRNLIFVKDEDLKPEEQSKQICFALQSAAQFIALGKTNVLLKIKSRQELQQALKDLYISALNIDVSDFDEKFSKTLGNPALWRKPASLLTYAATLGEIEDDGERSALLALLKTFAESVLNANFSAVRYAEGASEHLLEVHKRAPKLLEEWQKGAVFAGETFKVVDTDNPCDLLHSGSEVGSCQAVDRSVEHSRCLIAYLLDPKIRLMAIKNKDGVIVARCIIRLLFDEKSGKFVLFQEKTYPVKNCQKEYADALDLACKERAKQLGIALAKKGNFEGDVTLKAFKGVAPFEYVDGRADENAIATQEGYEIHGCKYS